jgi:hypothetical protein
MHEVSRTAHTPRAGGGFALDDDLRSGQVGVEPFRPALYDSRVVPGADEIAITLRFVGDRPPRERVNGVDDDRALKLFRSRLKALGVPER